MELFANELSLHGQFQDAQSFRDAFTRLMMMRKVARRFGRDVHCNRTFLDTQAMPGEPMQRTLTRLHQSERRAAMLWLTRGGPFWDDLRQHALDEWLECKDEVVTDSTVGEAAFRHLHGVDSGLVSVIPSDWNFSPVEVTWRREAEGVEDRSAILENWREPAALETWLNDAPSALGSWHDLRRVSAIRFNRLVFAGDCFEPLDGVPFSRSAAERICVLLGILDWLASAFDANGNRTPEGQRIYQSHFTGRNALFSDSSDREKRKFRKELTFRHPDDPHQDLFCPWHGKERHLTLRLHFTWPVQAGRPVYVVHAGPKITR